MSYLLAATISYYIFHPLYYIIFSFSPCLTFLEWICYLSLAPAIMHWPFSASVTLLHVQQRAVCSVLLLASAMSLSPAAEEDQSQSQRVPPETPRSPWRSRPELAIRGKEGEPPPSPRSVDRRADPWDSAEAWRSGKPPPRTRCRLWRRGESRIMGNAATAKKGNEVESGKAHSPHITRCVSF